jgi:hypothetical protein
MALDEDLARKLAHAEFSLQEMKAIGSGTPGHATAIETHFASSMTSLRSIVQYIAKHAVDWTRLDSWVKSQPGEDQQAWTALRDIRNEDIHDAPVVPHRVRRGGWMGNWFGPDYFGDWFGGQVVHQVTVANATSLEVIEFTERCLALMKRLSSEYRSL